MTKVPSTARVLPSPTDIMGIHISAGTPAHCLVGDLQGNQKGSAIPTFRIIGDSIVSQNCATHELIDSGGSRSAAGYNLFWNTLNWLTGNAFPYVSTFNPDLNTRVGHNSGVGGNDMTDVLARLPAILSSMTENYMLVHIGTNDLDGGASLSDMQANMIAIIDMIKNSNVTPILTTVLPRNAVDGSNDWGTTGTTQAQKRLILQSYNQWLLDYCDNAGFKCVNWSNTFTGADGQAVTGYTQDSLHPSGIGGYYMAVALQEQLSHILPKNTRTIKSVYDTYDAIYNPYGNYANGALTGSGGLFADTGGGGGTLTGTVPDGFKLEKKDSTTTDVVAAIVARTDGKAGNVLELTFTTYGTGTSSDEFRLSILNGSSVNISGFSAKGMPILLDTEYEIVAGHNGGLLNVGGRITDRASNSVTASTIYFDAASNEIRDSANGFAGLNTGYAVVSGTVSNNILVYIEAVAAGVLSIRSDISLTDEVAGASIIVNQPSMSVVNNSSLFSSPNETTPVMYMATPIFLSPRTYDIQGRFNIFIDGTTSETVVVRIANPKLYKMAIVPDVLTFETFDT